MNTKTPETAIRDAQREEHHRLRREHVAHAYFAAHPEYHLAAKVRDGTLSMEDAAKILEESARDPKTDLQRADLLQFSLDYETYLVREKKHSLTVAVVDIDYFKLINEELTHVGADEVLKDLATVMVTTLRESDDLLPLADKHSATRWGGEEFAVVLTGVDLVHGRAGAERLRRTIQERLTGRRPNGSPVTVSIGLSQYDPKQHEDAKALLTDADRQLLAAKAAGRNRVFPELKEAA